MATLRDNISGKEHDIRLDNRETASTTTNGPYTSCQNFMSFGLLYFRCYWPSNVVLAITCGTYLPNLTKIGQNLRSLSWTNDNANRQTGIRTGRLMHSCQRCPSAAKQLRTGCDRTDFNQILTKPKFCAVPHVGAGINCQLIDGCSMCPATTVLNLVIFIDCDLSTWTHVTRTVSRCFAALRQLHCVSKKVRTFKLSVTLSYLNRFSKFLHCWKAYEICYKTHMTSPTSP